MSECLDTSYLNKKNETAKESLLSLHKKLQNRYQSKVNPLIDVLSPYAKLGMRAATKEAFGKEINETDLNRFQLEVEYTQPKVDVHYAVDKLHYYADWAGLRAKTLNRLQEKYQISGLDWFELTFGNRSFKHLWAADNGLTPIQSDLIRLRKHKRTVVDFFLEISEGLDLWEWHSEWREWIQPYIDTPRPIRARILGSTSQLASTGFLGSRSWGEPPRPRCLSN